MTASSWDSGATAAYTGAVIGNAMAGADNSCVNTIAQNVTCSAQQLAADDWFRWYEDVKQRYERLRRWRAKTAEERGVESFVVARNELLMKIAHTGARSVDELEGVVEPFRLKEYGSAIVASMLAKG